MFSHGLHDAVVLPIVLVVLAVIGMLLGILFRVRAFLLSGFLALLVVMFVQIWNAAVFHSQTWVWWGQRHPSGRPHPGDVRAVRKTPQ